MALTNLNDGRFLTALFVFALLETLLTTGIIYGWANLVMVLKFEHVFLHLCPWLSNENNVNNTLAGHVTYLVNNRVQQTNSSDVNQLPYCASQEKMFNLIFTISVKCFGVAMLPGGILIDKRGPFVVSVICDVFFLVGSLGLSFISVGYEELLFPIFILFGLAGNLQAGCLYKVCNVAFQRRKSLVLCVLSGALDSSAAVFLVFKLFYDIGFGFKNIVLFYTAICGVVVISGLGIFIPRQGTFQLWIESKKNEGTEGDTVVPNSAIPLLEQSKNSAEISEKKYHHDERVDDVTTNIYFTRTSQEFANSVKDSDLQTDHIEYDEILARNTAIVSDDKSNIETCSISSAHTRAAASSIWTSIFSKLYTFHLIFLCSIHLKLTYVVGSLADHLTRASNNEDETVSWFINVFGYVQLGGLFITPLLGILFDRDTLGKCSEESTEKSEEQKKTQEKKEGQRKMAQCIAPIAVTIILAVALCVMELFDNIEMQIPQYILYTIVRGFLYAAHSAYIGIVFPDEQFGTLLGLGFFLASMCALLNYPLFELTLGPFNGNPLYTNVILLVLVSCSVAHPVNVWRKVNSW